MTKKAPDERSPKEAERIASDALRVMLTTPYVPQREQVGTFGRKAKAKRQGGSRRAKR